MGKKLDALLGKSFKPWKFKAMVNMAISRLAVLKNQRQARCSIARSDVVELLKADNTHQRALLRVEQVIKEQNMLDVFVLLETYCHLLIERVNLIEQEKVCPEELKEGVSSLIYAGTRCGEFPELQEIRAIMASRFGKEFVSRAVELRSHCGVNPKIIQKLATRTPSLETKFKVLKEIASDNNILLQIEEPVPVPVPATTVFQEDEYQKNPIPSSGPIEVEHLEDFSGSGKMRIRRKYKDVADAALAAFESAAYAADAAMAAMELSRSESTDPDDPSNSNLRPTRSKLQPHDDRDHSAVKDDDHTNIKTDQSAESEIIHPIPIEDDVNESQIKRSLSITSSESEEAAGEIKQIIARKEAVVFDESDGEDEDENDGDIGLVNKNNTLPLRSSNNVIKMESESESESAEKRRQSFEPLNINRRPISVRTKWTTHAR